ncbi:DUF2141 domain-containing protein [Thiotrichales bacterium 19X7-9]|nr:DUF2141 domain-containing protein [Thiotrichales bacterium 19X7-9]TNF65291.1 MAG: DUF2141 domain-containing protein [Gammaproteobacteria bacterium]UTW42775.1 DUF2141 domain-containing protein [bacterium SCSIO 12844]
MYRNRVICIILSILPLSLFAANLTVDVTNINSTKGQIIIGLFNNPQSFPHAGEKYTAKKIKPITGDAASTTFKNLPTGEYAVIAFHDSNDDGKLDRKFGRPIEQYGFSNNATGFMGPPSFSAAGVKLSKDQTKKITIKLNDA